MLVFAYILPFFSSILCIWKSQKFLLVLNLNEVRFYFKEFIHKTQI